MVLKEDLSDGYLTEWEYHNYVKLFHFAANRVLAKYPQMRKGVNQMTEPLIKLPSVIRDEVRAEVQAELQSQMKTQIAEQDAKLAEKDAEIQHLQEIIRQLSAGNPTP